MKKTQNHISISIFLQVLGIIINGVFGLSLEIIAQLISSFKKRSTWISILKKLVFIISFQILIDTFCGESSMIIEMGFFLFKKMINMVLIIIGLLIASFGIVILFFTKKNRWINSGVKIILNLSTRINLRAFSFYKMKKETSILPEVSFLPIKFLRKTFNVQH